MAVLVIPLKDTEWISGVGETYRLANWKKLIGNIKPGVEYKQKLMVHLVPEPTNKYDKTAVALHVNSIHVGYLPSDLAAKHFNKISAVYKRKDSLVAYGSIWAVKRGSDLNVNVSVNLPESIDLASLTNLEDAPSQPTRSSASEVSNIIELPSSQKETKAPTTTLREKIAADKKASALFLVLIILFKVFVTLFVAAAAQGISGTPVAALIVFVAGFVWIVFGKKIKAARDARKK
ncbi:HIRAN domain-containing protein [Aurantimicrobium minutum]|uniref:HIRAN domain-containing protein n=1 Tax=Aurantimicrobium minutum TaxID=708131 RepID=A0A173LXB8_9MICO|nr:HIRAN domain-containing protein [Aurantimicrobium minutum]BAU99605.1 Uncharacterized protein AUMI_110630 [Aurantimicrobium minutum]